MPTVENAFFDLTAVVIIMYRCNSGLLQAFPPRIPSVVELTMLEILMVI